MLLWPKSRESQYQRQEMMRWTKDLPVQLPLLPSVLVSLVDPTTRMLSSSLLLLLLLFLFFPTRKCVVLMPFGDVATTR